MRPIMPLRKKAKDAGVINPGELKMLGEIFDATEGEGESSDAREARASRILSYYLAGITDEKELRELARRPLGR